MPATSHPAVPANSPCALAADLRSILTGAAFVSIADRAFLRITGADATRWLNGMVTNAVQSLAPGEGCSNFLLNAQGRILGDCTIYRDPAPDPPAFLLETDGAQLDAVRAHLDRFIIMDDVELAHVDTAQHAGLLVLGPQVTPALERLGFTIGSSAAPHLASTVFRSAPLDLIHVYSPLTPAFELWSDPAALDTLAAALIVDGAASIAPESLEALRILSGIPRYGVDIRNTDKAHDLPQETAQDSRALNFAKGCYLGQEIVERIRSRGSVHRTFTGFVLTGELAAAGTELTADSAPRPVGELTSVAAIPAAALDPAASADAPPLLFALGYLRREVLDRNLPLTYPGGTASPSSLPFTSPTL